MLEKLILKGFGNEQKLNCAEKILYGANEIYNLGLGKEDMKLAAGFGGGMGIESTCGAVAASIMVLSKLFVEDVAHESEIKDIVREFINRYKDEMKSIECAPLKKEFRTDSKGCEDVIVKAAQILDEIVLERMEEQ